MKDPYDLYVAISELEFFISDAMECNVRNLLEVQNKLNDISYINNVLLNDAFDNLKVKINGQRNLPK